MKCLLSRHEIPLITSEHAAWRDGLAVLLKDSGLKLLTTICNSTSKRANDLLSSLWAPGIHVVPRHTFRGNIHTHKIK